MDDAQRLEACEDLHQISRRRGDGSGSASIVSASLESSPSLESSSSSTKKGASVSCASSGVLTDNAHVLLDQSPDKCPQSCSAAPACRISGAGRRLCGVNRLPLAWCVCASASTESHSSAHGKMYFQAASLCAFVDISAKVVCSQPKNLRFNSMGECFKTMAASGSLMSEETKWLAAARARPAFNARMQPMSHGCVRLVEPRGKNVTITCGNRLRNSANVSREVCGVHTSHNSAHASVSRGSWGLNQVLSVNSTKSNKVALDNQCDSVYEVRERCSLEAFFFLFDFFLTFCSYEK